MTDLISRQAAIDVTWEDPSYTDPLNVLTEVRDKIKSLPPAQPEWNNHTVACLLAELFGDTCACNYNDISEWLPGKCGLLDSCPNPVGVACWEQFLMHKAEEGEAHETD